jgi:hypothetical protein
MLWLFVYLSQLPGMHMESVCVKLCFTNYNVLGYVIFVVMFLLTARISGKKWYMTWNVSLDFVHTSLYSFLFTSVTQNPSVTGTGWELYVQCLVTLTDIVQGWTVWTLLCESGVLFRTDERTNGRTDMTKLVILFRNLANGLKTDKWGELNINSGS